MKIILIILIGLIIVQTFFSPLFAQDLKPCVTPEMNKRLEEKDPRVALGRKQLSDFTKQYLRDNPTRTDEIYIIPIVFHIVHNYGPENISKEQVLDAVRILNLDFRKLSPDTGQIISAFKAIAADSRIEFRLAQIDPYGNCTDGITRAVSPLTVNANDNVKDVDVSWDRTKYFNVWVVNSVEGAAAYAYYPANWLPADIDGVLVDDSYLGSIGTGSPGRSRVLTHEIGHSMNLMHTWGNSNSPGLPDNCYDDDEVGDTPNTIGHTACEIYANTCGSLDNVQNHMEYSYCCRMFTYGQKDRMRAALNSTICGRNNLWKTTNLIATGTNDGYTPEVCAPVAEFGASPRSQCQGSGVQYSDMSYNSNVDSSWTWNWSFPGGSPATSSLQNPVISYSNSGEYSATLHVANSGGADQVTKTNYVRILSTQNGLIPPFAEGMEYVNFPQHPTDNDKDWIISDNDAYTWVRTTAASYSGAASLRIMNNWNSAGAKNWLISPTILLPEDATSLVFTFMYAYSKTTTTSSDYLKVYLSGDCGVTWQMRWARSGNSLATNSGELVGGTFIPAADEWRLTTVNTGTFFNSSQIMVKFEITSNGGNYLYMDDINISAISTIENDDFKIEETGLEIMPNPFGNDAMVSYRLRDNDKVLITITNVVGKKIAVVEKIQQAGYHKCALSELSGILETGVYFVTLSTDQGNITRKVVCIQ